MNVDLRRHHVREGDAPVFHDSSGGLVTRRLDAKAQHEGFLLGGVPQGIADFI
jgi:hypothetical protein